MIAIIAILAAILFPVFAQAREKARQTACLSNMNQLGKAAMMYVQDYDETFPNTNGSTSAVVLYPDGREFRGVYRWPLQLQPYIKNLPVFVCPSDADDGRIGLNSNWETANPHSNSYGKAVPNSYAINEGLYWTAQPTADAEVNFPADTYYIADSHPSFQTFSHNYWNSTAPDGLFDRMRFAKPCSYITTASGGLRFLTEPAERDVCTRHNGGNVVLYADGHTKWQKWNQLVRAKANPRRTTP